MLETVELRLPKPGEIWELKRSVQSPIVFSDDDKQRLYSETARSFLSEISPNRYVMIVRESNSDSLEDKWQTIAVMVLSEETIFLSNVDVLIPNCVSGLGYNLLAESWHVLPMLTCNLSRPVGNRLSRQQFDLLLDIGDYYHGLRKQYPTAIELEQSGLTIGTAPHSSAFHNHETAWSDVLSVPIAAYHTYLNATRRIEVAMHHALQVERDLIENFRNNISPTAQSLKTALSQWLQDTFASEWQAFSDLLRPQPTWALRGSTEDATEAEHLPADHRLTPDEISALVGQLSQAPDEHQRRKIAKRLGNSPVKDQIAIRALLDLLQSTQDDETVWTAIGSLWQIDPGNSACAVRRVKHLDLGMQVAGQAVALAVALVQKTNQRVGVLLQVYPIESEPYLPTNLKLILLDEDGNPLHEITARQADICIQLKFSGHAGEPFGVKVALNDASITEDFVI
ncbi:DUF1822 family protein [Cyanobacteria bacterium FACHB-63]|nr:DUF1822 family protein [Cyanobacteria bacterium FACHB-63]